MIYKYFHRHAAKIKYKQLFHATQSFLANKDDAISLELYSTDFELTKTKDDPRYILSFKSSENKKIQVAISLGRPVLELGRVNFPLLRFAHFCLSLFTRPHLKLLS